MEKQLRNIDDAYKWSLDTVEALRAGDLSRIDMDELINEIGSIASGLRRELVSVLREIIEALLVLEFTSASEKERRESQSRQIQAQGQVQLILYSSPSLNAVLPELVAEAYQEARCFVSEDYRVSLPDACPIPLDRIVEDPYERMVSEP